MPSWFKGSPTKGGRQYDKTEEEYDTDLFSDLEFNAGTRTTETYNGGIAPVLISIDDSSDVVTETLDEMKDVQERPKEITIVDDTSQGKKRNHVLENPTNLDFCCIRDAICINQGIESNPVVQKQTNDIGVHDFGEKQDNNGSVMPIHEVNSKDSGDDGDTTGTGYSVVQLESIRGLGPIRDKKETNHSISSLNSKQGRRLYGKNRLLKLTALTTTLLIGVIAVVLLMLKGKKVSINMTPMTMKKQATIEAKVELIEFFQASQDPLRDIETAEDSPQKKRMKMLLDLSSQNDWNTEDSPQNMALDWLLFDDPANLSLENTSPEVLRERFAAATLYFSTDGPRGWTASLGFLGEDSICEWNNASGISPIGIFCGEGEVVAEITIVDNNLRGPIPQDLNYFSGLKVLNLYYNNLTGSIPDLSNLTAMEQLDLDGNELTGNVPESLFNMPSIVNLFLLYNRGLEGTIPEISDKSKLEAISLLGCSFSGPIPSSLASVSNLRLLQLKDNFIDGTIPSQFFSLPNLETLGLDSNNLVGSIPIIVSNKDGSKLKSLSLGSNSLEGSLPESFESLTSLQYLYADDNMLTGSIPGEVLELPVLEQLWLHNNKLSGDISDFSLSSTTLTDVYLSGNDFKGEINEIFLSAPTNIERLDLSGNLGVGGHISLDIGKFSSMKYFNASSCSLEGTLPGEIFNQLPEMTTFAIANNQISGRIPPDMARITVLKNVDLSNNLFTGDIPEDFANFESLESFDVSGNPSLRGDLTSTICEEGASTLTFARADCSSGTNLVQCSCCSVCCDGQGRCSGNTNLLRRE